jgi:hypothetical protein
MRFALLLLALASCASDPYLSATINCVTNAQTKAQADACREKLVDAGVVTVAKEGGGQ